MNASQRHQRLMDAFDAACERSGVERLRYVDEVCAGDPELRNELESLLAHDRSASPLDAPALGPEFRLDGAAGTTGPMPLPERIGEYEILGLLGEGGMGVVYHARQQSPRREVALKVIRPGRASADARRRFRTEILALARLRHPGIAAVYDAGTVATADGMQPFIAMEYVRGQSLAELVAQGGLSQSARVELLARICDAVEHAHQRGAIHRDLKPANILVETIDGVRQPRVLDFGVARLMDADGPVNTAVTQPGQLLGTLAYMSPEQLEGDPQAVDTRSDVYALGALGYELLTGRLPVNVRSVSALSAIRAVLEQQPVPMRSRDRRVDADLDTIILTALAKNREARYSSAAALAADLRRYLRRLPIAARPPSVWYALRKYAQRNRLLTAGLAVGVAGLVTGIVGIAVGLVQARQAAAELRAELEQRTATARFLTCEIVRNLDTIEGTIAVRRLLLQRLRNQVLDLRARAPHDLVLRITWAELLMRQSDLELEAGHYAEALQLREAALVEREALACESADPMRQAELSISLVKVGDVYKDRGELAAARPWYERAYEIDLRLVAAVPDSRLFLDNLAWSHDRLGYLELHCGSREKAEAHYRAGRDIVLKLLERDPLHECTLRGVQNTEGAFAGLARGRGDRALALEHQRAGLAIAERLLTDQPYNSVYVHNAVVCRLALAHTLAEDGSSEAAWHYDVAEQRARQSLVLDPGDVVMQSLLSQALQGRATAERRLQDENRGTADARIAEAGALATTSQPTRSDK